MAVFSVLAILLLAYGLLILWLELRHRLRPASPLRLSPVSCEVRAPRGPLRSSGGADGRADDLEVDLTLQIHNPHARMEVMVPELTVRPVLLGRSPSRGLDVDVSVTADHPDEPPRGDGYWAAYIVKGRRTTRARVRVTLSAGARAEAGASSPREAVDALWLDVSWINYGPFGRLLRRDGLLVALRHPEPPDPAAAPWHPGDGCRVLPLRTHLLGPLDDPLEVLEHYAAALVRPGDVLTIGETPLAVMQGRFHHPATVRPTCLARTLCRVFHPTSSLATACGMQTLIDIVGPARVLTAWILGSALKLVGSRGGFYRLAGEQARLIDDITGTTPPYDQTIVLGPSHPREVCEELAGRLGVGVAVVDVNDLGRVKVLAGSRGCDIPLLERALRPNPAGNADQRTPLVLVRPA